MDLRESPVTLHQITLARYKLAITNGKRTGRVGEGIRMALDSGILYM